MAFLFQLAIECDDSESDALQVKCHFEGQAFTVHSGKNLRLEIDEVCQDELGHWWVSVIVKDDLQRFLQVQIDGPELWAEAAKWLYERLKLVKGYRFALTGFEVLQFNHFEALPELIGLGRPMLGLVLSDGVFQEFGQPKGFRPFSDGYQWIPWDFRFDEIGNPS